MDAFYNLSGDPDNFVDITDISLLSGQFGKACPSRFTYNGDGLRVARAGSWLNSKYVWDTAAGLPVILKETDSHNAAVSNKGTDNTYVYGLGLISVTDRTGAQTYFTSDGLGSTTNLTNGTGVKTDTYTYDAFGAPAHTFGNSANNFQFTGQQRDSQSSREFYYLRARYYDPTIGRFLTHDPMPGQEPQPQTMNPYAYALNNPTSRVDPTGLASESRSLSCFGFVLGLIGTFAILAGGPYGYLIASVAFAAAFAIDVSQRDYAGAGADTGGILVSPFSLKEFSKFAPLFAKRAGYVGGATAAYSSLSCLT